MTSRKQRLTVTVDPNLIEAGNQAVAAGEADSLSGWVSQAMVEKAERARTLRLLAAAIADYEREFGEITPEEIASQRRSDRENATVVRRRRAPIKNRPGRTGKGKAAKSSGAR